MLNLWLAALSLAIAIVSGCVALYELFKRGNARTAIVITCFTLILTILFYIVSPLPHLSPPIGNATPTATTSSVTQATSNTPMPPSSPTPLPTPTATPTPNPCSSKPNSGTVLYRADWSQDTNGWVGSGDWTALNGMLVTAGNGNPPIFAPYHPGDNCITDYAVVATITRIKYNNNTQGSFGLVVRAAANGGGYTLSICAKQLYAFGAIVGSCADDSDGNNTYEALLLVGQNFPDGGTVLGSVGFKPIQNTQYTYRIEVKGNTIAVFINGNRIISPVTDNTYLSGGQVGIWSTDCQINVNSFEVVAL
jgi:hypothetical protein